MKKIPRITINRIELCKQPKSGAFRTAILNSLSQNVQRLWVWFTCCKKHSTDCLYKLNESHYEDLNTRHYLCCQILLLQLFVMSGGASSSWKGDRDLLKSKKVTMLVFPFFFLCFIFFFKSKTTWYVFATNCTNLKKQQGREETWEGERWGRTSIWAVKAAETLKCEFPNFSFGILSGKRKKNKLYF